MRKSEREERKNLPLKKKVRRKNERENCLGKRRMQFWKGRVKLEEEDDDDYARKHPKMRMQMGEEVTE